MEARAVVVAAVLLLLHVAAAAAAAAGEQQESREVKRQKKKKADEVLLRVLGHSEIYLELQIHLSNQYSKTLLSSLLDRCLRLLFLLYLHQHHFLPSPCMQCMHQSMHNMKQNKGGPLNTRSILWGPPRKRPLQGPLSWSLRRPPMWGPPEGPLGGPLLRPLGGPLLGPLRGPLGGPLQLKGGLRDR